MGGAVERLTKLVRSEDRFAIPYSELRQAQAEAMNERFEERVDRIKLLAFRAKEAGTTEIRRREDMVPLLFPHTAYKSYPGELLERAEVGPVGQMARHGLAVPHRCRSRRRRSRTSTTGSSVSPRKGHYVSCSSGTTGKSAMLIASDKDMEWSRGTPSASSPGAPG